MKIKQDIFTFMTFCFVFVIIFIVAINLHRDDKLVYTGVAIMHNPEYQMAYINMRYKLNNQWRMWYRGDTLNVSTK